MAKFKKLGAHFLYIVGIYLLIPLDDIPMVTLNVYKLIIFEGSFQKSIHMARKCIDFSIILEYSLNTFYLTDVDT